MFSPLSMSLFRISVLFKVSVTSLVTAVSGLGKGFALLATIIHVAGGMVHALRH